MKKMDNKKTTGEVSPWRVFCPKHGIVFLTKREYDEQMYHFNQGWRCVVFNENHKFNMDDPFLSPEQAVCSMDANWDDAWYERFNEAHVQRHEQAFQKAVSETFGDRYTTFSPSLKQMIQTLWKRGEQEGQMAPETIRREILNNMVEEDSI